MLFGFVLALIAGYTLGQQPRQRLIMLWSVWLLARLLWLALPFSVWVYALNSVFFIGLSTLAVPRFRAAKQWRDRKSTRLNSSHVKISYAVFCLKKKKKNHNWTCVKY